nr:RDD family protein [Glycomyces arizonensis]
MPKTGRRIAARAIDLAVLSLALFLLAALTIDAITEKATHVLPEQVIGAVTNVLFSAGDVGAATDEVGDSAWNLIVSRVQTSVLILIGFHFAYETAANLWQGRTLGRMLLDLRIVGPGGSKARFGRSLWRAAVTVVCTGGLYGLAWIALLHGSFIGGFVLWLLAVAVLVAYVAPALFGSARRSLGDLVAGTRTVHAGAYATAGRTVLRAAQAGSSAARNAAQRVPVQRLADSYQVRRAKETGGRWAARAADSEQGRRLRQLGATAGDRFKDVYRQRRGGDGSTPPDPQ